MSYNRQFAQGQGAPAWSPAGLPTPGQTHQGQTNQSQQMAQMFSRLMGAFDISNLQLPQQVGQPNWLSALQPGAQPFVPNPAPLPQQHQQQQQQPQNLNQQQRPIHQRSLSTPRVPVNGPNNKRTMNSNNSYNNFVGQNNNISNNNSSSSGNSNNYNNNQNKQPNKFQSPRINSQNPKVQSNNSPAVVNNNNIYTNSSQTIIATNNITKIAQPVNSTCYNIGDCVYFESSPTLPLQIGRIDEISTTSNGDSLEVKIVVFFRRRDISNSLITLVDKYQYEETQEEEIKHMSDEEKALLKQRELFYSRQIETIPASSIRGKCTVQLLNESETLASYINKDDHYFYTLVYDPTQKTITADRGEIRVGSRYQAEVQPQPIYTPQPNGDPADPRNLNELETLVYTPDHNLSEDDINKFLTIAKSVGTFARALDCSSSIKQPSLHLTAASASRDVTLLYAMQLLHQHDYDLGKAVCALVPSTGPVLCRDEIEEWTAGEATLFEEAIEKYGREFNDIRQDFLPWKSVKNIVEYYYMWKTTDRSANQRRMKALEADAKVTILYITDPENEIKKLSPSISSSSTANTNVNGNTSTTTTPNTDNKDKDNKTNTTSNNGINNGPKTNFSNNIITTDNINSGGDSEEINTNILANAAITETNSSTNNIDEVNRSLDTTSKTRSASTVSKRNQDGEPDTSMNSQTLENPNSTIKRRQVTEPKLSAHVACHTTSGEDSELRFIATRRHKQQRRESMTRPQLKHLSRRPWERRPKSRP